MKILKSLFKGFKKPHWGTILGYRNFYDIDQLEIFLTKKYIIQDTFDGMEPFLLFSTKKQHTWLVRTDEIIYCILDDISKNDPVVRWNLPITKLVNSDGTLIKNISVNSYRSDSASGIVDFGHRKSRNPNDGWYYTKSIHSDPKVLKNNLTEFIIGN